MNIDLASIGRELKTSVENIQTAVDLLDGGNTIPFITRFRKDQTAGLTEDQLLIIKSTVAKMRALAERKAFVVKSIDSQGKLSDKISKQIEAAQSSRQLEDIYHPFKPRKQTLATVARQNGLEPLALDIFEGREPEKDLASRATDFVRVDKDLNSVDEVIAGVGHLLAEKFSENASLRNDLRTIISAGKLTTTLIEIEQAPENDDSKAKQTEKTISGDKEAADKTDADKTDADKTTTPDSKPADVQAVATEATEPTPPADQQTATLAVEASAPAEEAASPKLQDAASEDAKTEVAVSDSKEAAEGSEETASQTQPDVAATSDKPKKKKKKKKKKKVEDPYKEFHEFKHAIGKMPYHKTLAINRGEKNGRLKVKIEFDDEQFANKAQSTLVPDDHPFKEFLNTCVKDAMNRLVTPSLERELRREITEASEKHAVQVFARNLKNLLLQSPVRDYRVLAIDPGYKRGCSVAVLETNGQLLEDSHIFVVGNEKRIAESKQKLIDLVNKHSTTLVAIGNGAACREAEQMVSDMIKDLSETKEVKYAMVNEAGASFYSTSEVGREEFPDLSPAVRSAVSIGRRLIDPLSELVKISPANIGVGLYQHDVRAKHLAESLDDVVQFCVNRVGVDANTASPSLMRYVSGLNQLTARRMLEYRQENGPFKNREELRKVTGFGEATFVQAAGFVRIHGGDQPLDTTGIHPEFYETASKVLEKVGCKVEELFPIAAAAAEQQSECETKSVEDKPAETKPLPSDTEASAPSEPAVDAATNPATEDAKAAEPNASESGNSETAAEVASTVSATPATSESETDAEAEPVAANDQPAVEATAAATAEQQAAPAAPPKRQLTCEQIKRRKEIVRAIRDLDAEALAGELGVGRLLMKDILHCLCRPEYDPRNNFGRPVFRSGIIKIDDLKPEMRLDAQVVNVVDFGVFVDIGLGTSCLVHVSQLSRNFIRDPHRFYAVGDSLKVWVTGVETAKRRVKLTAVQPGTPKSGGRDSSKQRRHHKPKFEKSKHQHSRGGAKKFTKARKKPKPVKPITDDMLTGSEPMRSFSDLAQFYDKSDDKSGKGKKK